MNLTQRSNPPDNRTRNLFENLMQKPISYSELSWDSSRAAQMRLQYGWAKERRYNSFDLELVVGNPNQSTTFYNEPEKIKQQFDEALKIRQAFLQKHKSYFQKRHEEYKKIFKNH